MTAIGSFQSIGTAEYIPDLLRTHRSVDQVLEPYSVQIYPKKLLIVVGKAPRWRFVEAMAGLVLKMPPTIRCLGTSEAALS